MAVKESGLIGRQDKLLTFGSTGNITSAGNYVCGSDVVLDMFNGDTNPKATVAKLDGFSVSFTVDTAFAGLSSVILKVQVCDMSNGTYRDAAISRSIPVQELTANASFKVAVPHGALSGRYVRAAVASTGTATAGVISAAVDTFAGI
jgi:hypothetical protein